MSNLKFPFKLKTKEGTVYTAVLHSKDIIGITWTNRFGTDEYVTYSLLTDNWFTRAEGYTIIQEDPTVSILQSDYDSMVEEINLLQELLSEANIKLTSLENQYEEGINKPIDDYTEIDWLKAVAGAWVFEDEEGKVFSLENQYEEDINKPIYDYTEIDWLKAVAGKWMFEDGEGKVFSLIGYDYSDTYPVDAAHTCFTKTGKFSNRGNSTLDIIRRVS
jgi:hypothetical protein